MKGNHDYHARSLNPAEVEKALEELKYDIKVKQNGN